MTLARLLALTLPLALAACQQGAATPARPVQTAAKLDPEHPVVVELYQSQGCSSCPPALMLLDREAERPGILALNFAVTYWDQLGWKDRFAKPEFTARQWEYSRAQGRGEVATPTLIVNGRRAVIGSNAAKLNAAIAESSHSPAPSIAAAGASLSIGALAGGHGAVWLADYDPRRLPVSVGAGENGGRTLIHRNIVKSLKRIGDWRGTAARLPLPPRVAGLDRAVLIQDGPGGPIVAARRI